MKKRLFIALGATEIAEAAEVYLRKLKINFSQREIQTQWVPKENWHITLIFLGSTEEKQIEEINKILALACSQFSEFKLKISDFGAFPDIQKARVIWCGVQRSKALLELQSLLEEKLAPLGFAPEPRDYWPHLTIGRLRNPKGVRDALSPVVRKDVGVLKVSEVRLYESQLATPYPKYKELEVFNLRKSSAEDA